MPVGTGLCLISIESKMIEVRLLCPPPPFILGILILLSQLSLINLCKLIKHSELLSSVVCRKPLFRGFLVFMYDFKIIEIKRKRPPERRPLFRISSDPNLFTVEVLVVEPEVRVAVVTAVELEELVVEAVVVVKPLDQFLFEVL